MSSPIASAWPRINSSESPAAPQTAFNFHSPPGETARSVANNRRFGEYMSGAQKSIVKLNFKLLEQATKVNRNKTWSLSDKKRRIHALEEFYEHQHTALLKASAATMSYMHKTLMLSELMADATKGNAEGQPIIGHLEGMTLRGLTFLVDARARNLIVDSDPPSSPESPVASFAAYMQRTAETGFADFMKRSADTEALWSQTGSASSTPFRGSGSSPPSTPSLRCTSPVKRRRAESPDVTPVKKQRVRARSDHVPDASQPPPPPYSGYASDASSLRTAVTPSNASVVVGVSGPHRARPSYNIAFPAQLVSDTRLVNRRLIYTFHSHADELRHPVVDGRTGRPICADQLTLAQVFEETRLAAQDLVLAWDRLSPSRLRNLGNFMHLNCHWLAAQADKERAEQAWDLLPQAVRERTDVVERERVWRDTNEREFAEMSELWGIKRAEMMEMRAELRDITRLEASRRWVSESGGGDDPPDEVEG
ncbi:hypothetical protein P7C70_g2054, partial [Phenoliferia sp. Uapishka_3]